MDKPGLLQLTPGQITFPQLVIGVGRRQDGALALRVHQDIGPAAFAGRHHVVQVNPAQAISDKNPVLVGPQPPHQGRREPQTGQGVSGIGRLAAAKPAGGPAKMAQQVPEPGLSLSGQRLFPAPGQAGAPISQESGQVSDLIHQIDVDGPQAKNLRLHPRKVSRFPWRVKAAACVGAVLEPPWPE